MNCFNSQTSTILIIKWMLKNKLIPIIKLIIKLLKDFTMINQKLIIFLKILKMILQLILIIIIILINIISLKINL